MPFQNARTLELWLIEWKVIPKKISSGVDNWYLDDFFLIHLRKMIYLSRADDISSMSADYLLIIILRG
jgi:hypothetical protein